MNRKILINVALFVALLFHTCGLIGILFTTHKDWFISNTPINLLVMALLLVLTHPSKNKNFFFFFFITIITGFVVEAIGVNTHALFGNYTYGNALGFKLFNVPLIIGINWFLIIYCTAMVTQVYESYMIRKIQSQGVDLNKRMKIISFIADAAFLTVFFDWMMEPVAEKLGFWQWKQGDNLLYNYLCWIVISALLLAVFRKLNRDTRNVFGVHLLVIQLLFFLVLRTFL